MLHSPVIDIYEPLDNEGKPTGKINIDVKHPFVFNIRRIPKTFKGIEVKDITVGKVPKEFAGSNLALPWFEIFSPENYVRFVDKNIKAICERLKEPKWSKTEVLDALSSGEFREFSTLFTPAEGRLGIVVCFLALLELGKAGLIEIVQDRPLAPIYLKSLALREPDA